MKKRPETKDSQPKNPNDHKMRTPGTANDRSDAKFTSYNTNNPDTSTPQRARESGESSKELERNRKAR
jgi:hypothetical protein